MPEAASDRAPGLIEALRRIGQQLLGAAQTRLALLASDIEEQRERMTRIVVLWALAAFFLALAIMLAALLVVVIFWDTHRIAILAVLTGLFAAAGIAAIVAGRSLAGSRPKAFSGTLAALAGDQEALDPRGGAQ
jgi:uncharacterized membrane protein YqjE